MTAAFGGPGNDLPPLLHPRVLMDLDGYSAWERHMIGRCADVERRPEAVLATLMRDADLLPAPARRSTLPLVVWAATGILPLAWLAGAAWRLLRPRGRAGTRGCSQAGSEEG